MLNTEKGTAPQTLAGIMQGGNKSSNYSVPTIRPQVNNNRIDFGRINQAALSRLSDILNGWLPGGRWNGGRYECADRDGGPGQSFKVESDGSWKEFNGGDSGSDPVSLYAHLNDLPQGEAAKRLAGELGIAQGNGHPAPRPKKNKKPEWTVVAPVPENVPSPRFENSRFGKFVQAWPYRNASGQLLGYTARYDLPERDENGKPKKVFRTWTYCRSSAGGNSWRCKAWPSPRPIYGLDRIHSNPGAFILWFEGEKACDAAQALCDDGTISTAFPGGSSAVKSVDLSPLKGRSVLPWPDNDEAGFKAVLDLAEAMEEAGTPLAGALLPDPEWTEKADVADFPEWNQEDFRREVQSRAVTLDEFRQAAHDRFGLESKGTPPKPVSLNVVTAEDLLSMDLPERGYILFPIIPAQGLCMAYAPRGLGKTWFALHLACCIASGEPCFGWRPDKPQRVLYLDGEMPATTMRSRLISIATSLEGEPPTPGHLRILTPDLVPDEVGMPNLSTPEGQALIAPYLEDVDLIVVDNLATLARHGRENETESWKPMQDWLLSMRRAGKSVLLIHHAGKSGYQRGTSSREDILDTVIAMKRPQDYRAEDGARFEVHFEKARGICGDDASPFEVALTVNGGVATWTMRKIEDAENDRISGLHGEGLSPKEIALETGLHQSTVYRRLKKLGLTKKGGES